MRVSTLLYLSVHSCVLQLVFIEHNQSECGQEPKPEGEEREGESIDRGSPLNHETDEQENSQPEQAVTEVVCDQEQAIANLPVVLSRMMILVLIWTT